MHDAPMINPLLILGDDPQGQMLPLGCILATSRTMNRLLVHHPRITDPADDHNVTQICMGKIWDGPWIILWTIPSAHHHVGPSKDGHYGTIRPWIVP